MSPSIHKALEFHQAGLLDRAEAIYLELLRSNPKNFEALHLRGVIATQVGDHLRAIDCIGNAIRLSPNNPNFHFNLGVSLEELGRFREAADSFGEAGRLQNNHSDAFLNRGNCLYRLGDLGGAMESYDLAIKV
jgi:tetratricopeptide (TPR) repeat protein